MFRDRLNGNIILKTLEEFNDQYDYRINYLKYFCLITIPVIQSKNIAQVTESKDRHTLLVEILNYKNLSKEIYY